MLTLKTFKKSLGIEEIEFKKASNGRQVADLKGINLIISLKCDMKRELFVTECTSKEGDDLYVICNQGWSQGVTL